ncbi:MAG: HAD family hydrolase [Alphaproteobacteria bacterium]|nr:HAD family hydrolase [Alphaproteobacteria bacterium]
MSLAKPDIVIFDMDGTTVRHMTPRLLHVLETLDDAAFKIGRFFRWIFERQAQGPMILESEKKEKKPRLLVHRAMHKMRRKPVEQIVEPCPGIYSVLGLLQKNGIPMGLASSGLGQGYGHDILEKFGLAGFFQATVFREDLKKSKPNPEPILLTLERMGITPARGQTVWYVGDRHKDITAALAADRQVEGRIVPIACGLNAAVAVIEKGLNPEHIMMSLYDLHARLRKLLQG